MPNHRKAAGQARSSSDFARDGCGRRSSPAVVAELNTCVNKQTTGWATLLFNILDLLRKEAPKTFKKCHPVTGRRRHAHLLTSSRIIVSIISVNPLRGRAQATSACKIVLLAIGVRHSRSG